MHIISHKKDLLQKSLTDFFSKPMHFDILSNIVYGHSPVSLRMINFFITTYARNENVMIKGYDDEFLVYQEYKICLKAYSIKYFDPFCRRERVHVNCGESSLVTTVGQMNVFRWIIENDVLSYIIKHQKEIVSSMKDSKHRHESIVPKNHNLVTLRPNPYVHNNRPNSHDDFILTF